MTLYCSGLVPLYYGSFHPRGLFLKTLMRRLFVLSVLLYLIIWCVFAGLYCLIGGFMLAKLFIFNGIRRFNRFLYTTQRAPMAHRRWSQEQYGIRGFFYTFTLRPIYVKSFFHLVAWSVNLWPYVGKFPPSLMVGIWRTALKLVLLFIPCLHLR